MPFLPISELTGQRNTNGGGASTSVTFTFASAPTKGNLVVLGFSWRGDTTVSAVPFTCQLATNGGNGSGIDSAIYYKIADGTEGTTWTFTLSASNKSSGVASEFSGINSSFPLDKTNSNTATGTAGTTGATGTLSITDELVIALYSNINTNTWSLYDNSQGEIGQSASTGGATNTRNTTALATRTTSATTSVNYGATLSGSQIWSSAVATFRAGIYQPAQAQALIKTTVYQVAQAQADIKQVYQSYAQAQASILQVYNSVAQANALIDGIISGSTVVAQANAIIGKDTNLYSYIDEEIANDSDYIVSPLTGSHSAEVLLGPLFTPDWIQDFILRWRVETFGASSLNVYLYQGAVLIATTTVESSTGFTSFEYRLTPSEMAAITDFTDLRVRFTSTARVLVSWVEFQVPSGAIKRSAQAQASIKAVSYVFGQAQADILQTYYALAQAQADIKQVYYSVAQAQADIKQIYYAVAQAQASIKTAYYALGQAQADIKQTYYGLGQAQAQIKQTYYAVAQAQAAIVASSFAFAQAEAYIAVSFVTRNAHAQAQALIFSFTQFAFGQAAAKLSWVAGFTWGISQASIKSFGYPRSAQAAAYILNKYALGQAQAEIQKLYLGHGQAQAYIVNYFRSAQAQAYIVNYQFRDTTATVETITDPSSFPIIALGDFPNFTGDAVNDPDELVDFGHEKEYTGWLKLVLTGTQNLRFTTYDSGMIDTILYIYNTATIDATSTSLYSNDDTSESVSAADLLHSEIGDNGATVTLTAGTYWILVIPFDGSTWNTSEGLVQLTITNYGQFKGYGQAQAKIAALHSKVAQAQALINSGLQTGQARAVITSTRNGNIQFGQALSDIRRSGIMGHGQARAFILTKIKVAQARAKIKRVTFASAQAQAYIGHFGFGQAQAIIETGRYIVNYGGLDLPGYAQSEDLESVIRVESSGNRITENLGRNNKTISLTMRVVGNSYAENKEEILKAATILRRFKTWTKLYLGDPNRYYLVLPKKITTGQIAGVKEKITDYTITFEAKPWLYSNLEQMLQYENSIQLVQEAHVDFSGAGGTTVTLPQNVTAGNLLITVTAKRNGGTSGLGKIPKRDNANGPGRTFTVFNNQFGIIRQSDIAGPDALAIMYRIATGDEKVLYWGYNAQVISTYELSGADTSLVSTFETLSLAYQTGVTTKILGDLAGGAGTMQFAGYILNTDADQTSGPGWDLDSQQDTGFGHPGFISMHATTNPTVKVSGTSAEWGAMAVNMLPIANATLETTSRTIDNGSWAPVEMYISGQNITISGYTASDNQFAGFISASGIINNMYINTETYEVSIDGEVATQYINNPDYDLKVGPGKTIFDLTNVSSIQLKYRDRWEI